MNRPRLKKILLRTSAALALLILLTAAAVWFLTGTQKGTEWLFTRLGAVMPGEIEVARMTGPLRGPLEIWGLKYEREGFEMYVEHVRLEWRLRALLERRLDIERLYADGVRILTTPSEEEKGPLPDVNLRYNIIVRDARVRGLSIASKDAPPGEEPFVIDRIALETTAIRNDVRIDALTVRAPTFDADVRGTVRPQGDYPVNLTVKWTWRDPQTAPFSGEGRLSGTLADLQVNQTLSAPFSARLDALLHEPLHDLSFDGRLRFSGLDPRQIRPDLADLPVRGPVQGVIAAQGTLEELTSQGELRLRVEELGDVQLDYRLAREGEAWRIHKGVVELPGTPTRLTVQGTLATKGEDLDLQAEASWRHLAWPLRGEKPAVRSPRGTATISGDLERYRARVRAEIATEQLPTGEWVVAGTGNRQSFSFQTLEGNVYGGRLHGRGDVAWKPLLRWNAELRAEGIDPEQLAEDYPGSLSFAVLTRGQMSEAGPVGRVEISHLEGTVRGEPVAGDADLRLAGARHELSSLDLTWSDAQVEAAGWIGDTLDLRWQLSVPNLGLAIPQGGGSVVAQGNVSGPPETPRIEATAEAEGLRFGETTVAEASAAADVDLSPAGDLDLALQASGVLSGERRIEELTVRGEGQRSAHRIVATARNEEGRLDVVLAGGLTGETSWEGQIRRLALASESVGDWNLERPAELAASPDAVRLDDFCWAGRGARVCAEGAWAQDGPWQVDSTISDLPLSRFKPFLPPDLEITGDLDGTIQARGQGSVLASADVDLQPGPGEIRFPGDEGRMLVFRYEQGSVEATAGAGGQGIATARIVLVDVGTIDARAQIPRLAPGTPLARQPLAGRIDVNLTNLAFLEGFVPDIDNPAGSLVGGYRLAGTFGDPRFVGRARLADGRADIPRLGIQLRDLRLSAVGDGTGALALDGSVRSGRGTLALSGQVAVPGTQAATRLSISGRRFQAMDTEEISLLASPDLEVTYEGDLLRVTGEVRVPTADIEIAEREEGAVTVSDDVVFVNQEEDAVPEEEDLKIAARVRVILGDDVSVQILGLKAQPTGSVLVIEQPGRPTRGVGELEIDEGTFRAYGQDLTIERGRLIFAGPLDNPRMDVRAFRRATDGTVAGIEAKGTLESPEVTLWSDPPMGQSEALAYLLLGRPLDQVSPEEGDQLANAARALGIRGGNLLAKKLAARFGLEEARIETEGSTEQARLVLGKFLSPRLYVSYGMGIFEPVNTFRVRYILSDKWTLQAETGEGVSADALYTVERGGPDPRKRRETKEGEKPEGEVIGGGGG